MLGKKQFEKSQLHSFEKKINFHAFWPLTAKKILMFGKKEYNVKDAEEPRQYQECCMTNADIAIFCKDANR